MKLLDVQRPCGGETLAAAETRSLVTSLFAVPSVKMTFKVLLLPTLCSHFLETESVSSPGRQTHTKKKTIVIDIKVKVKLTKEISVFVHLFFIFSANPGNENVLLELHCVLKRDKEKFSLSSLVNSWDWFKWLHDVAGSASSLDSDFVDAHYRTMWITDKL